MPERKLLLSGYILIVLQVWHNIQWEIILDECRPNPHKYKLAFWYYFRSLMEEKMHVWEQSHSSIYLPLMQFCESKVIKRSCDF